MTVDYNLALWKCQLIGNTTKISAYIKKFLDTSSPSSQLLLKIIKCHFFGWWLLEHFSLGNNVLRKLATDYYLVHDDLVWCELWWEFLFLFTCQVVMSRPQHHFWFLLPPHIKIETEKFLARFVYERCFCDTLCYVSTRRDVNKIEPISNTVGFSFCIKREKRCTNSFCCVNKIFSLFYSKIRKAVHKRILFMTKCEACEGQLSFQAPNNWCLNFNTK